MHLSPDPLGVEPSEFPTFVVERPDWRLAPVSVVAKDRPVGDVLLEIARQVDASVVIPPDLAEVPVSLEMRRAPGQIVLETIGRQLDRGVRFADGVIQILEAGTAGDEGFRGSASRLFRGGGPAAGGP
jgi:type II secretory pathway component GspD/PulD (secretin)